MQSQLAFNTALSVHPTPPGSELLRANKIICTIGPATQAVDQLKNLMISGMNVARMNFSHGTHEYHQTTINNVRQAAAELNVHCAIALDTKGPEIRCGMFKDGSVKINAGDLITVTTDPAFEKEGTVDKFYVDYKNLPKVVKPGGSIYVDDGELNLEVLEIHDEKDVVCKIRNNHVLSNQKGVNLPMAAVDLPAVSERDKSDLMFGAEQGVDFIFASFIRNADQVEEVRKCLGDKAHAIHVYCKIENHQGCDNIDSIIAAADGIMVARGDLGVEIPAEKVVVAQKMMISKCNVAGKPVICATQMLESMTDHPRPTRAEVSDVANAVLDGADAVMLSGETAKGKYPTEVVSYMARIVVEAQQSTNDWALYEAIRSSQLKPLRPEDAIASASVAVAEELGSKALLVLSTSGNSARLIAKYRPAMPVLCVSMNLPICRQLQLCRSIVPMYYSTEELGEDPEREKRVTLGIETAKKMGLVAKGDVVVAAHAHVKTKTKGTADQTRVLHVQ